jgi:peptidoglycan pentaglycine glycine transferase (the first glycine)
MIPAVAETSGTGAGVRVVDATSWSADAWDELATRSRWGEAFQSHAWGETKATLGWRPLRVVIEAAGERVAVASLQERTLVPRAPGPIGHLTYLYAPRGPVLLRRDPDAASAALAGLRLVARARRAVTITIDPSWEDGSPLATRLAMGGFGPAAREIQVSRTAMLVPLRADQGEQHQLLGDSSARNINKARRAGVSVERIDLADPGVRESALGEFWEMFAATGRREGFIVRDRGYQLDQWRSLGEAGIAFLWFTSLGGRRQNGVILLACGTRLVSHVAGSADDAELRATRANHLLQWEIMRWGAAEGFEVYDLGGVDTPSAPGLPLDRAHPLWNLYEFKRGFGARGVVFVRAHEHAPRAALGLAWRFARRLR